MAANLPAQHLLHTPEGSPYVALQTRASEPIFLTKLYPFDAQAMFEVMSRPDVNCRLETLPCPYTINNAEEWIKIQTEDSEKENSMRELPLIAIRAYSPGFDGEYIGSVGLRRYDIDRGEYVIGYVLNPEWQRQGIVPSAVKAALWHATSVLKLVKSAIIQVSVDNEGSAKVVEGLDGFEEVKEMYKMVEWSEEKGGKTVGLRTWRWFA